MLLVALAAAGRPSCAAGGPTTAQPAGCGASITARCRADAPTGRCRLAAGVGHAGHSYRRIERFFDARTNRPATAVVCRDIFSIKIVKILYVGCSIYIKRSELDSHMDGVHDLGGTDGFGSVDTTEEGVFAAEYQGLAHSMTMSLMGHGVANVDEFRHTVERLPPAEYLNSAYYDRWLKAIEALLIEKDVIEPGELAEQRNAATPDAPGDPDTEAVLTLIEEGGDWRKALTEPAFDIGQRVTVKNRHPSGHTRCPGYLRRATGTVVEHHGTFVLPDANAHGKDDQEPMYAIEFESAELWGEDAESNTAVYADLWESYLRSDDA